MNNNNNKSYEEVQQPKITNVFDYVTLILGVILSLYLLSYMWISHQYGRDILIDILKKNRVFGLFGFIMLFFFSSLINFMNSIIYKKLWSSSFVIYLNQKENLFRYNQVASAYIVFVTGLYLFLDIFGLLR